MTAKQPDADPPVALEARGQDGDGRRFSPSVGRNRIVIGDVFCQHMPETGPVLEIASGTGEHGAYILTLRPGLSWTYSDIDPAGLESQRAWQRHERSANLKGPLIVDTRQPHWGEAEALAPWRAMYCANMIHIAPFAAAEGLFLGAGRLLGVAGKLMLYGPFARNGQLAPSNAAFDASLKHRDPDWGVRDLERDILPLAATAGLHLAAVLDMPANNLAVIFQRD